ncbi:hypothetical protein CYY_001539 [Polysphondylium violaceum]|uniref:Fucosyltransferase n=1 Tax=Polysphondylium violaceum TaxID=133409 RepID=A0A8J4Q342_9MYCE|nr:hypothetical protein CYY_001539 [Polysphondylium violaceum]
MFLFLVICFFLPQNKPSHLAPLKSKYFADIDNKKLNPLPIVDNKINVRFMSMCWFINCVDVQEVCFVDGEKYDLNLSRHHPIVDTHMQVYHDPDIVDTNYVTWVDTPNTPRVLINPESFLNSRCAQYEECVNRFHWVISTSVGDEGMWPYFLPGSIHSSFLSDIKKVDFQQEVLNPKLMFRREDQLEYESNATFTEPYKPAIASWFTSNCQSTKYVQREQYVMELMKHIKIDSYGACAHNRDLKNNNRFDPDQKSRILSKYKFYFSFENSYCRGYHSEKSFQCLQNNVVPVMMTHPDNLKLMPRGSYIFVGDFKSAKELAEYLTKLENDDVEYQKYFTWKSDPVILKEWYDYLVSFYGNASPYCKLAELYINWIKQGGWTLSKSRPLKNVCLRADYFPILSKQ